MATLSFLRDFDVIVNEILVDYLNLAEPPPDTSRGSMVYIFANVMASQSYGLNAKLDFISNQIGPLPSTATDFLDREGTILNLPRFVDEKNGDYYNRIINRKQNPPSAGNANDYKVWALDREKIFVVDGSTTYFNKFVTIIDAEPQPGVVTVSTIPDDESIIGDLGPPNNEELLRVETFNYIESVKPLGILQTVVVSAIKVVINISIDVIAGPNFNLVNTQDDIKSYGDSLAPGVTVFVSQLQCICINNGAVSATSILPASDAGIGFAAFYRFGTITITEV